MSENTGASFGPGSCPTGEAPSGSSSPATAIPRARERSDLPSADRAKQIYAVLVEEAGAKNDPYEEAAFIRYLTTTEHAEWRFVGCLGFGGKLYNNRWDGPRVGYYSEHKTPERDAVAAKCNARLKAIPR